MRTLVLTIPKVVEGKCCRPEASSRHLIEDIEAKQLQLENKNAEILTLTNALNASKKEFESLLLHKTNEISNLNDTVDALRQENLMIRTLHNRDHMLNETFAELRDQIRIKDRTIMESSVKLSLLTQKLAQKEIEVKILKENNEKPIANQEYP